MSTADAILSRLDKVRQTASNRWMAKCPAHEDRDPSLSIRELSDGRTLVYCFAGCAPDDILAAVSLSWADLYPPDGGQRTPNRRRPWAERFNPAELLEIIDHEVVVSVIVLADVLKKRSVSADQLDRLSQAASRIGKARDHAMPREIHPSKTRWPSYGR